MEAVQRAGFTVVGLKITTSNKEAMTQGTIGKAWENFFGKDVFESLGLDKKSILYVVEK